MPEKDNNENKVDTFYTSADTRSIYFRTDVKDVLARFAGNTPSIFTTRCITPQATCSNRSSPAWRSATTTRAAARR